jgi:hypothetical protein
MLVPRGVRREPPIRIAAGSAAHRKQSRDRMFSGNIGYHVYPPARGHHFAERACRCCLPLARRHGMERLWITCNPTTPPPAEPANDWREISGYRAYSGRSPLPHARRNRKVPLQSSN